MARVALPLAVLSASAFTALAFLVGVQQVTYLPIAVVVGWLTAGFAGARREHPVGGLVLGVAPFAPLIVSLFTLDRVFAGMAVAGGLALGAVGYGAGRLIPPR